MSFLKHSSIRLLSLILLFSACAPQGLMRTWITQDDYDHQFKNIMVMGLVNNVNLRSDVESQVVFAARKASIVALNGMSMFPPELGKPFDDVERAKERMRKAGHDGILTVTLVDISAPRYVNASADYEPLVFYNRFGNYYVRTYDLVYKPGYFATASKYFIETNFYELGEGKLVWSGRSTAFDHSELQAVLPRYANGLFRELQLEGVIIK